MKDLYSALTFLTNCFKKLKIYMKLLSSALLIIFLLASHGFPEGKKPFKPSPSDKCPICGMFVAKYPDWIAQIIFKDGSYIFFDGAKDMFRYYFNMERYNPKKKQSDIDSVYVTDYYNLNFIDGYEAYYVVGSNVYGPMGRELIPIATRKMAEEFLKDHYGKKILKFNEVTMEDLK